jgi:hypothetical protein
MDANTLRQPLAYCAEYAAQQYGACVDKWPDNHVNSCYLIIDIALLWHVRRCAGLALGDLSAY